MRTAAERKATERIRRRQEGLRPHEIWVHPKDWPFVKEVLQRIEKRRSKSK